jgi:hypothetical protein
MEIISGAREYLRRWSFAAYCDTVLMPALRLSRADYAKGQITLRQQAELRDAIVHVVEALNGAERDPLFNPKRKTVLEKVGSDLGLSLGRVHRVGQVEIPPEDRISEEGKGFKYILHGVNLERIAEQETWMTARRSTGPHRHPERRARLKRLIGLAQGPAKLFGDETSQRIGTAAGRRRHDDAHRLGRPGLRLREAG